MMNNEIQIAWPKLKSAMHVLYSLTHKDNGILMGT